MELSQFYNLNHKFNSLTLNDQICCLLNFFLRRCLGIFFYQTIFLLVIQIVFGPAKLTRLQWVNPKMVLKFFLLKNIL